MVVKRTWIRGIDLLAISTIIRAVIDRRRMMIMRSCGRRPGCVGQMQIDARRPGCSAENEGDHKQGHTDTANDVTHVGTLADRENAA